MYSRTIHNQKELGLGRNRHRLKEKTLGKIHGVCQSATLNYLGSYISILLLWTPSFSHRFSIVHECNLIGRLFSDTYFESNLKRNNGGEWIQGGYRNRIWDIMPSIIEDGGHCALSNPHYHKPVRDNIFIQRQKNAHCISFYKTCPHKVLPAQWLW